MVKHTIDTPAIWDAIVLIMTSLQRHRLWEKYERHKPDTPWSRQGPLNMISKCDENHSLLSTWCKIEQKQITWH